MFIENLSRQNWRLKNMVAYGFVEDMDYTKFLVQCVRGMDFTTITQKRVTNNPKNPYTEENVDYTILKEKVDSQKRLRTYEQEDYILTLDIKKRSPIISIYANYRTSCLNTPYNL